VQLEVLRCDSPQRRCAAIAKLWEVAAQCRNLCNFQCAYAVFLGLNATPVRRLRLSWEELPMRARQLQDELTALFAIDGSFKALRSATRNAALPCIPFLGLVLKVSARAARVGAHALTASLRRTSRRSTNCRAARPRAW
jgi:son of sevenless-like protein